MLSHQNPLARTRSVIWNTLRLVLSCEVLLLRVERHDTNAYSRSQNPSSRNIQTPQEQAHGVMNHVIALRNENVQLQRKNAQLAHDRAKDHARLSSTQEALGNLHKSYLKRLKEKDAVLAENAKLQTANAELRAENVQMLHKWDLGETGRTDLEKKVSDLESEKIQLEKKVSDLKRQLLISNNRGEALDRERNGKDEQIERLQRKLDTINDVSRDTRDLARHRSPSTMSRFDRSISVTTRTGAGSSNVPRFNADRYSSPSTDPSRTADQELDYERACHSRPRQGFAPGHEDSPYRTKERDASRSSSREDGKIVESQETRATGY
jgi:hypothetical protein